MLRKELVPKRKWRISLSTEPNLPLLGGTCREASRLISESLDRELTRRERWALRLHTVLCTACRRFADECRLIRSVLEIMPAALRQEWFRSASSLSPDRKIQIRRLLTEAREADNRE